MSSRMRRGRLWAVGRVSGRGSLLLVIVVIGAGGVQASDPPSTSGAATRPTTTRAASTSQAASRPALDPAIERLVLALGDRNFKRREEAQRQLESLGEKALPALIAHLDHPNREIAMRAAMLARSPEDPELRIELVLRLLDTMDADQMERGVHMLFEEPEVVCERFIARTADAKDLQQAMYAPIVEMLKRSKSAYETNITPRMAKAGREDPDKVAEIRRSYADTNLYNAEAAYWGAYEAMLDFREGRTGEAASQPTQRPGKNEEGGAEAPPPSPRVP